MTGEQRDEGTDTDEDKDRQGVRVSEIWCRKMRYCKKKESEVDKKIERDR